MLPSLRVCIDPSLFTSSDPERLPCRSCDSMKLEPTVVICDSKECCALERAWRRSCGDRGIHSRGGACNARRREQST